MLFVQFFLENRLMAGINIVEQYCLHLIIPQLISAIEETSFQQS